MLGEPALSPARRWSAWASTTPRTCPAPICPPASAAGWRWPGCSSSDRPVWLLDEPTSALDAASQAVFADLVPGHSPGGGIVVAATHVPLGLAGVATLRIGAPPAGAHA